MWLSKNNEKDEHIMNIKQIQVHQLLNKITKKDMIFHGNYTLDPYQNCSFGCIYCDSTLDDTIYVKINSLDRLEEELPNLSNGRIIIGSVHDPYQPLEKKFQLTHNILNRLSKTKFPIHILTKSTTILKDLPIIKKITNPIVTFTVLGLQEKLWKTIEPNTPSPLNRLQTMKALADQEITTGIAIIPTLPHFPDQHLEELIHAAKKYQAAYILHKPLFLQGEQKQQFLKKIKTAYPEIYKDYNVLYQNRPIIPHKLEDEQTKTIQHLCNTSNIPTSIPLKK